MRSFILMYNLHEARDSGQFGFHQFSFEFFVGAKRDHFGTHDLFSSHGCNIALVSYASAHSESF